MSRKTYSSLTILVFLAIITGFILSCNQTPTESTTTDTGPVIDSIIAVTSQSCTLSIGDKMQINVAIYPPSFWNELDLNSSYKLEVDMHGNGSFTISTQLTYSDFHTFGSGQNLRTGFTIIVCCID